MKRLSDALLVLAVALLAGGLVAHLPSLDLLAAVALAGSVTSTVVLRRRRRAVPT